MTKNLTRILLAIGGAFVIILILVQLNFHKLLTASPKDTKPKQSPTASLPALRQFLIGDKEISVELADTPEAITRGLSGKKTMPENYGMLFRFATPQQVSFWMPDMFFPIDIVFIKDGTVEYIEANVPNFPPDTPKDKLPIYSPTMLIDTVLEVPANFCKQNNITVGTKVKLL